MQINQMLQSEHQDPSPEWSRAYDLSLCFSTCKLDTYFTRNVGRVRGDGGHLSSLRTIIPNTGGWRTQQTGNRSKQSRMSQVVQWLRLWGASKVGTLSLIPDQGTKIPQATTKTQCSQINKNVKKRSQRSIQGSPTSCQTRLPSSAPDNDLHMD